MKIKIQIVVELKNQLWWNSKSQMVTQPKNSNYDNTQIVNKNLKLKMPKI